MITRFSKPEHDVVDGSSPMTDKDNERGGVSESFQPTDRVLESTDQQSTEIPKEVLPTGGRISTIYVEVLGRHQEVKERVMLASFPATIGRAYHNQVIIDDPYVSPIHAEIDYNRDVGFTIRDCNSKNGTRAHYRPIEKVVVSPTAGLTLSLGKTSVRIRTCEYNVAPTLRDLLHHKGIGQLIERPQFQIVTAASAFALIVMDEYQDSTTSFLTSESSSVIGLLLLLIGWSGVWSFINRIVSHRFQFPAHLATANIIVLFFIIMENFLSYISFILGIDFFYPVIPILLLSALVGVFLYNHLSLIGTVSNRKRIIVSLTSCMAIFIMISFSRYEDHSKFSEELEFYKMLKPVNEKFIPSESLETFLTETNALKREVDELVEDR